MSFGITVLFAKRPNSLSGAKVRADVSVTQGRLWRAGCLSGSMVGPQRLGRSRRGTSMGLL